MRENVHTLLADLDELRAWMLENGVFFARCGDLELRMEPEDLIRTPEAPPADRMAVEVDPEPRKDYDSAYDDPDLYLAVGGDPIQSTGKLPGER